MSTHLITVACEGPHDTAFLNRLLKANGFIADEKRKIAEYPAPMGQLFVGTARKIDFEQLNFTEARRLTLPSHALSKGDVTIFLYSLGGDGKIAERNELLKKLWLLAQEDEAEIQRLPDDTTLSMIYMFDADDHGIERRIAQIRGEVAGVLGLSPEEVPLNLNADCCEIKGLGVGCLVVGANDGETGRLEDIIVPIMTEGNEDIFAAAEKFLDTHFDEKRCLLLKVRIKSGAIVEARESRVKHDRTKSVLGIAAQLQLSGKSNTACISDADYLNLQKLTSDKQCLMIWDFFNRVTTD